MVLEARWYGFAAVSVSLPSGIRTTQYGHEVIRADLDKFYRITLFFAGAPCLEGVDIGKGQGISVIGISASVGLLRRLGQCRRCWVLSGTIVEWGGRCDINISQVRR